MRYEIKNGKNKTYYFKNELKEFGCQFKKTGKYSGYWYLNTEDQFLANRLQAYCLKKGLTFLILESSYSRNVIIVQIFLPTINLSLKMVSPIIAVCIVEDIFKKIK